MTMKIKDSTPSVPNNDSTSHATPSPNTPVSTVNEEELATIGERLLAESADLMEQFENSASKRSLAEERNFKAAYCEELLKNGTRQNGYSALACGGLSDVINAVAVIDQLRSAVAPQLGVVPTKLPKQLARPSDSSSKDIKDLDSEAALDSGTEEAGIREFERQTCITHLDRERRIVFSGYARLLQQVIDLLGLKNLHQPCLDADEKLSPEHLVSAILAFGSVNETLSQANTTPPVFDVLTLRGATTEFLHTIYSAVNNACLAYVGYTSKCAYLTKIPTSAAQTLEALRVQARRDAEQKAESKRDLRRYSPKDIADEVGLSEERVKHHLAYMASKGWITKRESTGKTIKGTTRPTSLHWKLTRDEFDLAVTYIKEHREKSPPSPRPATKMLAALKSAKTAARLPSP